MDILWCDEIVPLANQKVFNIGTELVQNTKKSQVMISRQTAQNKFDQDVAAYLKTRVENWHENNASIMENDHKRQSN